MRQLSWWRTAIQKPEEKDINEEMDVRKHDKPLDTDNAPKDNDKERADYEPYNGLGDEPTEQHDEGVYDVPPIDDIASEGHDEVEAVYKPDTEADKNSTKNGGPDEGPIKGVNGAKTHDGEYMTALDDRNNDTTTMQCLQLGPIFRT